MGEKLREVVVKIRGKGSVSLGAVSPLLFRPPNLGTYNATEKGEILGAAMPDANYVFDHWGVDGVNMGSQNPLMISVNRTGTRIEATFLCVK